MNITRAWAMPSPDTFSIKPIAVLAYKWLKGKRQIADPFARNCLLGTLTNDLNPNTNAKSHLDALHFVNQLPLLDAAIIDPPYSYRQIAECYSGVGKKWNGRGSELLRKVKDGLAKVVKPGGIVISCGWNSSGMGENRKFKIEEILLVAHGGSHNDTICVVERKLKPQGLFK